VVRPIFCEVCLTTRRTGEADQPVSGGAPSTLAEFTELVSQLVERDASGVGVRIVTGRAAAASI
jgi:hypothetical protein